MRTREGMAMARTRGNLEPELVEPECDGAVFAEAAAFTADEGGEEQL